MSILTKLNPFGSKQPVQEETKKAPQKGNTPTTETAQKVLKEPPKEVKVELPKTVTHYNTSHKCDFPAEVKKVEDFVLSLSDRAGKTKENLKTEKFETSEKFTTEYNKELKAHTTFGENANLINAIAETHLKYLHEILKIDPKDWKGEDLTHNEFHKWAASEHEKLANLRGKIQIAHSKLGWELNKASFGSTLKWGDTEKKVKDLEKKFASNIEELLKVKAEAKDKMDPKAVREKISSHMEAYKTLKKALEELKAPIKDLEKNKACSYDVSKSMEWKQPKYTKPLTNEVYYLNKANETECGTLTKDLNALFTQVESKWEKEFTNQYNYVGRCLETGNPSASWNLFTLSYTDYTKEPEKKDDEQVEKS